MRKLWILALAMLLNGAAACSDDHEDTPGDTRGEAGEGDGPAAGSGGAGAAGARSNQPKDIVETAVAAGSFKQLAAALTKANLVEALSAPGPFTVFAPTDAAFDAFEKASPGALAKLSVEELTQVLKYHVLSGAAVKSSDLKNGQLANTLAGPPVAVDLTGDKPKVGGATVSMADIEASNGVIHVIDDVLLPPANDLVETAVAAGSFTKLAAALQSAGLVEALKAKGPFTVFAPTDAAFNALSEVPSGATLKNVLLYHVVMGAVGAGDLKTGEVATLLADEQLKIDVRGGVKVNDATVTMANVVTKNGVIHVIDKVLVPN